MVELIEHLRPEVTLLAGYSAGGVIAMSAATQAPEKVTGMLLSNTGPCAKGHGNPDFVAQLKANWGKRAFLEDFLSSCFSGPVPPVLLAELLSYAMSMPCEAAVAVSSSLREVDLRPGLRKYTYPVTVAHGMKDTRRTMDHVQMMLECMPQAKFIPLDAGHTAMVEDKAGWQNALDDIMSRIAP